MQTPGVLDIVVFRTSEPHSSQVNSPPPLGAPTLRHVEMKKRTVLALVPVLTLLSSGIVHSQEAPAPCSTPGHRQFDFWIGEWTVNRPDGQLAGENSIEPILNGCVLKESYHTPTGYTGQSFNIFDVSRETWHQTWVDVGGALLLLEGGLRDGAMVLEGKTVGEEGEVMQRITWSIVDENPNRVRQLWETSTDAGQSWTVAFDGLYVRKGTE